MLVLALLTALMWCLDTTAALHTQENLWPGLYKLQVMVSDAQGLSCPVDEVFTLHVCTCVDSEVCHAGAARRATSSSELSAAAIGLLLLGVALLLRETVTHADTNIISVEYSEWKA